MRVAIRADASPLIGAGHLMRCLALAEELRAFGDSVTLLTSPSAGSLTRTWERLGVSVKTIESATGSTDEGRLTLAELRSSDFDWVVLDGYQFGRSYRTAVRRWARLMVLDDLGARGLTADLVLNGNLYASNDMYPGSTSRLLLGPRYALIRRQFRSTRPPSRREGVLLSFGGADPGARSGPVLKTLAERGIRGLIVIGALQRSGTAIHRLADAHGWRPVHAGDHMARLLRSCEVAVIGAGATTLEALAVGAPTVAVVIADNQVPAANELRRLRLANVAQGDDPEGVAAAVLSLLGDEERQRALAQRGPRFVDGRGAVRVAAAMRESLLTLRSASMADAEVLLAWRNDPVTRAASFATEYISREDHVAWLQRTLLAADEVVLIGEVSERPVGVIRLSRQVGHAVISVIVATDARGAGMATSLIRMALEHAASIGITRVAAHIREENDASRRAFGAAGFALSSEIEPKSADALVMVARVDQKG